MTQLTRRTCALFVFSAPVALAACRRRSRRDRQCRHRRPRRGHAGFPLRHLSSHPRPWRARLGHPRDALVTEVGLGASYGRSALLDPREHGGLLFDRRRRPSLGRRKTQRYSHVLFFMTEDAILQSRTSPGWAVARTRNTSSPTRATCCGPRQRPRSGR